MYKAIDGWLKKAIKPANLSTQKIDELKTLLLSEDHQKVLPSAVAAIKEKRTS